MITWYKYDDTVWTDTRVLHSSIVAISKQRMGGYKAYAKKERHQYFTEEETLLGTYDNRNDAFDAAEAWYKERFGA